MPITPDSNLLEAALRTLNTLLKTDPKACRELLLARYEVNSKAMESLPSVHFKKKGNVGSLSFVGLLNGMLSEQGKNAPKIALVFSDDDCVELVAHQPATE